MRRRIAPAPSAALAGGALAVGVGGLYLAGLLLTGGETDAGTTVWGLDIGGLSREEATQRLEKHLSAIASRELIVKIGDRSGKIDPRQAGLTFDTRRTVDRALHTGADPVTVIGGFFRSGGDVEPVVRADEGRTRAALEKLAKTYDQTVRDGAVTFDKGRPKEAMPRSGYALNVDAAVGTLRTAFADGKAGATTVLPTRETKPKVTAEETRRAMREFAGPAMSAPVTLTMGGERITISPVVLGAHLKTHPDPSGKLTPKLDSKGLRAAPEVARPLAGITGPAENAELRLDGDRVVAETDGKVGQEVTDEALGKAVMPLLTQSGPAARTGEVATEKTQPKVTRENAAQLGLTEKLSSFTVDFPPTEYRKKNIGRAAELINGSLVMPNETWSFNRTVGERTKENGFVDGTIILNDRYTKAAGGGVSTVATAVFNAMFFAGVKPVEYGAHSFYIERYPEGREATVAWGSLDLRFNNDSGKAIYIQAQATDSSVTVTFLGTKKYDQVKAAKGPRTNVRQPGERAGAKDECEPQTPLEGFDVTVERVFYQDGREVMREPFRTHYTPRDKVTCN
ncbi:VanW family protein [Streptomyces sp. ISL-100]|uniref:VanW family protein n=1 Tax=Streptomyces sp. ISL-100 TaxID=2819173 RepID=UPI001BED2C7B|nr:VanW family protein [Streptomyces sp. ISL-100]MBT2396352.1 VanW family protein [Streptomyces sp. ISL-100]